MDPSILEIILDGGSEPTYIRLAVLENITGNFSNEREIGRGALSTVYEGILPNGKVAVKRFTRNLDDNLFRREVNTMLDVNHKNIVRFLGYCSNTDERAILIERSKQRIYAEFRERLLCFEHMSNGGMHNHITDELRGLEWDTRYQIITEICDGLNYLHNEKHIIHTNLKPSNILLDNHMRPKITDFHLSRLCEDSLSFTSNRFFSLGYLSPEYRDGGQISAKSDIYSFGVTIIELVTGQRGFPDNNSVLRRWMHRWRKSRNGTPFLYQQVIKCLEIGALCQESDPDKRPSILDIIRYIDVSDVTNEQINNFTQRIGPYSDDQMIGIEPLELHFPFELNKHISCSLELTNEMGEYIAFNITNTSPLGYFIKPNTGILPPQSKSIVKITLQAQEKEPNYMKQAYAFIVQSTKVEDGQDIIAVMFNERIHNVVDEVNLDVVLDAQQQRRFLDVDELDLQFPSEPNERIHNVVDEVNLDVVLDAQQQRDVDELDLQFPSEPNNLTPMVLKLDLLKKITSDFSANSELGRGAYGVVYKGVFPSGYIIAVKKLATHLVKDETFQSEVNYLTGIKHQNVVQFVGYCAESSFKLMPQPNGRPIWFEMPERLICLEYVCNKSLNMYISDESTGLEWNTRYDIIKGIITGLHLLHEKYHIVHLDLKPENILMDAAMVPKIADFGLSRIFDNQETHIITANRPGTRGYMAPEYTLQGRISTKADIFSLGVIIIQILTGHKEYPISSAYLQLFNQNDCPQSTNTSFQDFTHEVVGRWRKKFLSMPKHKSMEKYTQQVKQCIILALKCVEPDREKRPTTTDLIRGLNAADQVFL